ncbi:MAG: spermine synthase [Chloroflexi bacterium]|nr:spermine synthase [Chloroflexota bacterium]MDL1883984.1 spermine synthase [Anaerolineae bacterium CFX8]
MVINTADQLLSPRSAYLYVCVFTGGMTTLAVELSASRLLGNIFGTSNIVWANVIGLILLYLTVGYFIGGRWADRSPHYSTFYRILVWSAFLSALIPLVSRPILTTAAAAFAGAQAALTLGSFFSILILFSVPVTLLGCVSPFAIRLALSGIADSGRTAGRIYAVSTLGSLVGTFLPTLFIIPELGTLRTFLLFGGILYVVGFIGLWQQQRRAALRWLWMPLLIGLLTILAPDSPLRPPFPGATLLYEDESAYNFIQVQEDAAGNRYLYLNEGQGIHSQWSPDTYADDHRTWSFFLTAPYFNNPPFAPADVEALCIVGLAAGTIARQYTAVYGPIPIDGIEIDPGIIEAGARYFDMNAEAMPNLTVYAQDGRYMLNQLDRSYTVIAIDAYRPPYIPWHLTTVEFFQEARRRLADNGVVAVNVGRTNTDRRLIDALAATLRAVFPNVYAMDVPNSFNTILVATSQPASSENLAHNLSILPADAHPLLRDALTWGVMQLAPVGHSDLIFTDDRAPVETLVDSLVLNFLISGGTDQLAVQQP